MKGMLLAGGTGSRLGPLTAVTNKHLLPIFDKPMLFYSLSVLMLAGCREVLVVCSPGETERVRRLVGSGENLGMSIDYVVQHSPGGIAHAMQLGQGFADNESLTVMLGDNVFFGPSLGQALDADRPDRGVRLLAYHVSDPTPYASISFDGQGAPIDLSEKADPPLSSWVATGLYFFGRGACSDADSLTRSARGELEVTDLNRRYLLEGTASVTKLPRGTVWFDVGTVAAMQEASQLIQSVQDRQGYYIGCIEEVAWRKGWIDHAQLTASARRYGDSEYANYIRALSSD